jgi:hypothetical protein
VNDHAYQEFVEAERELERMGWEALERCYNGIATAADVLLLAKLAGLTGWKPNAQRRAA